MIEAHCEEFVRSYLPSRRQVIVLHTDAHTAGVATQRLNSVHAAATESSTPVGSLKKRKLNKNHNALKAAEERAARNGTPVGILPKLSDSDFARAVMMHTRDKEMSHFFAIKHNFKPLVDIIGSETELVCTILNKANGLFPASGVFEDIFVELNGYCICLHGRIVDGIPRMSTMFPVSINGMLTKGK